MIRKTSRAMSCTALAAAIAFCHQTYAEPGNGFTISPRLEYQGYDTYPALDDYFLGGIGLGYRTAGPLAFEFTYLAGEVEPGGSTIGIDTDVYRVDALMYLAPGRVVQPFLLLGAGKQRYDFEGYDLENDLANAGVGLDFAVNDMFSIRTDMRAIRDLENDWTSYSIGVSFSLLAGGARAPAEPVQTEPVDADDDGVADQMDRCLGTPMGTQVDANGCERVSDDDGDGVANDRDRCPDSSAGAKVDADGCYITISETHEETLNIVFPTGSAEVDPAYFPEVQKIADFMREYATTQVVIEGHTDDRGSVAGNFKLSQRRAEWLPNCWLSASGWIALACVPRVSARPSPLFQMTLPKTGRRTAVWWPRSVQQWIVCKSRTILRRRGLPRRLL